MNYPKTAKEAKKIQSLFYFTEKPCKHGHLSKRYTSNGWCAECLSENQKKSGNVYAKKSREKNKEKNKLKGREEYRKLGKNYIYLMWSRAKQRAQQKNIDFNIELSDIVIPKVCPVLKAPFEIATTGRGPGDFSPSLDRIIHELGYVKGNIEVISFKANRIKSDAGIEDVKSVLEYMETIKTKYSIDIHNNKNNGMNKS